MISDKIETFTVLEHYGIHSVRAKYVDSAEDAIAFAARRDAPDERPIPIVLRGIRARKLQVVDPTMVQGPLVGHEAIRRAYEDVSSRLASGGQILATNFVPPGSDIAITGRSDEALGKCVTLRSAVHSAQRMVPFDEAGAEVLARNLQAHEHHGTSEKARRMLEHLLVRVSTFFEDSGVESFDLDPVRLHDNGYTVLDATLRSRTALHVKGRLAHDAHDRKAHGYRPSGRQ